MANGGDWENAVALSRAAPSLGVGVHLNLVQGRPLLSVPSLTDAGTGAFLSLGRLARRALAGGVDRDELAAETRAQIDRLRDAGIAITHLDSHRHAHALPRIFPVVARVVSDAGIRVLRVPREPLLRNAGDAAATARKLVLALSLRLSATLPLAPPLVTTDHFRGISMQGGAHFARRFLRELDTLPPGTTEIMVHPGYPDAALAAQDPYLAPRSIELAVLRSPEVRARLSRGDFALVSFAAL